MSREEWIKEKQNELNGRSFGRLIVIEYSHKTGGRYYLKCQCECGNIITTRKDGLLSGHTQSCGCARDNWMHSGQMNRKHGLYQDRAYWVWAKIKSRCYNKNAREYSNYGGRGIKMCDEWLDPKNFIEWCYGHGYDANAPKGECTIERIDTDGNYEPSNYKFATNLEQQNNRRDCHKIEYNGQIYTIAEWARILDIPYSTLRAGLLIYKKPMEYYIKEYKPRKSQ